MTIKTLKLVMNMQWLSLPEKLKDIAQRISIATNNHFRLDITVEQTNFINIPFQDEADSFGLPSAKINREWYKENITPKGVGYDIIAFVMPQAQYMGRGIGGWTSWNNGKYEIEFGCDENAKWIQIPDMWQFSNNLLHELLHALKQMASVLDNTHTYALYNVFNLTGGFSNIPIDGRIYIRKIGWQGNPEKGYYIPADTMDRLGILENFTTSEPDYQTESKEWTLSKRPW